MWVSYDLPDRRLLSGPPAISLEELIERGAPPIVLTAEQQAYLQQLGPITLAPDPDWLPYESIDAQGNFTGIAADLLALLEARLGLQFHLVPTRDWDEALALSQAGAVLALPFLNQTPEREDWLIFTEPLFIDPNVFVTRREHPFITDAAQLAGERVVLPSGTSIEEFVRRDFPDLEVLLVPDERQVFQAVEHGKADLAIRSLAVAAYTIRKEGLFNLQIAGQAPEHFTNRLRMGILKDEPMLRDILNQGIATITPREREVILNRHVNIEWVQLADYGLIVRVVGTLLILLLVSAYWSYRLKREVDKRIALANALRHANDRLTVAIHEEQQANQRQCQFLHMIGHEFRTPLTVVTSSVELIRESGCADLPPLASVLQRHDEAVGYMTDLINNALNLEHFTSASLSAKSESVEVAALLRQVVEYYRYTNTSTQSIDLETQPGRVMADPALLTICIHNLLDNALKFSPPGSRVFLQGLSGQAEFLIRVCDEGPGIAEADLGKIFDKYYRQEGLQVAGFGLGLYIVAQIIHAHGGDINVHNRPEGGCCFTLRLPGDPAVLGNGK